MTLAGWLTAAAGSPQPAEAALAIDFSVLTPAMEGRYFIGSGVDFTTWIPPYVALSKVGSGAKNDRLRSLVARERYEPEREIADRLIERLAEASYRAVYEPVERKPAGSVQSLSWSDLPEHPGGRLMLDITIRWICLCADIAFTKYFPAISISWRLLDPAQVVVLPSRTLSYHHFPAWYQGEGRPRHSARDRTKPPQPEYPVENVSEACGFDSVKEMEKNPMLLWGCLGEAYDAALRRLVIDLKKLQPPRTTD